MISIRLVLTAMLALVSAFALASCVTQEVDAEGNVIVKDEGDADNAQPVTEDGLLLASIYRIESPTVVYINRNNSKKLTFAGVTLPSADEDPDTYSAAMSVLVTHQKEAPLFYIRMSPGTNLNSKEITGTLMRQMDKQKGYFDITQGLLSLGLLRISNPAEFASVQVAENMRLRQEEAQRKRLGMWGRGATR